MKLYAELNVKRADDEQKEKPKKLTAKMRKELKEGSIKKLKMERPTIYAVSRVCLT